jgi:hypothetical protein
MSEPRPDDPASDDAIHEQRGGVVAQGDDVAMRRMPAEDLSGYERLIGLRYKISLVIAEGKGRCAIAEESIRRGFIIEIAPTIVIEVTDRGIVDRTSLTNYYFNLRLSETVEDVGNMRGCVPLGIGNICNHSNDPNAAYCVRSTDSGFVFVLFSIRDIEIGEEICVRYRKPWFDYQPPIRRGEVQ